MATSRTSAPAHSFRTVRPTVAKEKAAPSKSLDVYIAFSVHGSNAFARAQKQMTQAELDKLITSGQFKQVKSLDPKSKGIKLEWSGLINKSTGQPYKSALWIVRRFEELHQSGWTIDLKKFKEYHWKS